MVLSSSIFAPFIKHHRNIRGVCRRKECQISEVCVEGKNAKYQRCVSKKIIPNIRGVCRRKECQISGVFVEEKNAKYQRCVSRKRMPNIRGCVEEKNAKYQMCVSKNALKTCGPGSRQFELKPDQLFVTTFVTSGLYRPDPILFRLDFNFNGWPDFLH